MKVIVFGATGMVGQAAVRECLLDPAVEQVLLVTRRPTGVRHDKASDLVHDDFLDFSAVTTQLTGYDACFFCLGVSSAGMTEADYRRVTFDIAMAVGRALSACNPAMTFIFISGTGADGSEQGRVMWARVKGETENALRRLPFKAVYAFRPGYIQPMDGITSRTGLYRALYLIVAPFYPALKALAPSAVITTRVIGRALIEVAAHGAPKSVLENRDITEASRCD